jgi:tripartite motif-containing protein 71
MMAREAKTNVMRSGLLMAALVSLVMSACATQAGPLAKIYIAPGSVGLLPGARQQFAVYGVDAQGQEVAVDTQVTWTANPRAGKVTKKGLYTAGAKAGVCGNGIRAEVPGLPPVYAVTEVLASKPAQSRRDHADSRYLLDTIWGGRTPGEFTNAHGAAVDGKGDICVLDGYRVQKLDPCGNYLTSWGSYGKGNGEFLLAAGIAADSKGNVYISDVEANRVQKFDTNGEYLYRLGGLGSDPGQFFRPTNIVVDAGDNLYVVDSYNHRVQEFDPSGKYVRSFGSFGRDPGKLMWPSAMTVDRAGNVYIIDTDCKRIQKFDSSGKYLSPWTPADIPFTFAQGIAADPMGGLCLAKTGTDGFQWFDAAGKLIAKWGYGGGDPPRRDTGYPPYWLHVNLAVDKSGSLFFSSQWQPLAKYDLSAKREINQTDRHEKDYLVFEIKSPEVYEQSFYHPTCLAVDRNGNIYFGDDRGTVRKLDLSGLCVKSWRTSNAQPYGLRALAVDGNGHVYAAHENGISKFDASGALAAEWGSKGDGPGQFQYISGIAVDGSGNVFVSDGRANRVQKFDPSGKLLTQWGSKGAGKGEFNWPIGLAIDRDGDILVCDSGNRRIQKFDLTGKYISHWGEGGYEEGQMDYTAWVVTDKNGNIYVADNGRQIHKFDSSGKFITRWGGEGSSNDVFGHMAGLGIDEFGNVYVADNSKNRIMKFKPKR